MLRICAQCGEGRPPTEGGDGEGHRCLACVGHKDLTRRGTFLGGGPVGTEPDLRGEVLGPWRLDELLGCGGMSTVWRASHVADGRVVAVKVLAASLARDPDFVRRLKQEAGALARIDHPHIVRFLGQGEDRGRCYVVLEYHPGRNLRDEIAVARLPFARAMEIFVQTCSALAHAHRMGVVHRDIKPANLLVGRDDGIQVLDFGIARLVHDEEALAAASRLTRTAAVLGTLQYMAPEQLRDPRAVDHRADLFSLGVVLYEMLTGTVPVGSFAPPSRVVPGIPRAVDRLVTDLLRPDPRARPATADQVLGRATRLLGSSGGLRAWLVRPAAAASFAGAGVALAGGLVGGMIASGIQPAFLQFPREVPAASRTAPIASASDLRSSSVTGAAAPDLDWDEVEASAWGDAAGFASRGGLRGGPGGGDGDSPWGPVGPEPTGGEAIWGKVAHVPDVAEAVPGSALASRIDIVQTRRGRQGGPLASREAVPRPGTPGPSLPTPPEGAAPGAAVASPVPPPAPGAPGGSGPAGEEPPAGLSPASPGADPVSPAHAGLDGGPAARRPLEMGLGRAPTAPPRGDGADEDRLHLSLRAWTDTYGNQWRAPNYEEQGRKGGEVLPEGHGSIVIREGEVIPGLVPDSTVRGVPDKNTLKLQAPEPEPPDR
ncbi:protein kinase [Myxococcota bacterium]|nr:protein kinase [Myxococcota bacterium]